MELDSLQVFKIILTVALVLLAVATVIFVAYCYVVRCPHCGRYDHSEEESIECKLRKEAEKQHANRE